MAEIAVGDLLADRYEVHAIRRGGMGLVFLGYDRKFQEPVALKTFQDRFLADERSRQRFQREAEAWVQLDRHPNIVYAHYFVYLDKKPYLALEMVADGPRGNGLRRRLRAGPLGLAELLAIGIQICRGLHHAGQKLNGLVHRDLKPENLLITPDEVLKVTDFGLVRSLEAEADPLVTPAEGGDQLPTIRLRLTRHGVLLGTPQYMAPEQFAPHAELDVRADIYACGVILFETLVGRPPFSGRTTKDLAQAHVNLAPPRPAALRREVPEALETIVLACLSKDPAARPSDFQQLERELVAVATQIGVPVPPAVEAAPLQSWEQSNKGSSLVALGHPREGLRCFDLALEKLPRYVPAHNNRGVALRALDARHDASSAFLRALEIEPGYVDAWYNLGVTLGELGSSLRERACYEQVLGLQPEHFDAWHNNGISLLERFTHLRAGPDLQRALESFEQALALRPHEPRAHYHRALARWAAGDGQGALSDLELAAAAQPPWEPAVQALALYRELWRGNAGEQVSRAIPLPPPPPAAELIENGNGFAVLELWEEALALYDEARELHPASAGLQRLRGEALRRLGRLELATEAFEAALVENPDDVAAMTGWGQALLDQGRISEARDRFLAASRARPSDPEGWCGLAEAELRQDRPQQALKALIPAEFSRRDDPEFWNQRARAALALRRPKLALQYFKEELRIDPRRAAALCGAAEALHQLQQMSAAKSALLRAIRTDSSYGPAWCLLARIFLSEKQAQDAMTCLQYARSRGCDDAELDRVSARVYLSQGRIIAAAAAFESLLKRLPLDTEAELGLKRCRQELARLRQPTAAPGADR